MMTLREAMQRMEHNRARMTRRGGEYRVTLNEWPAWAKSTEDKAYYTDDLEDAVLTAGAMRREQSALDRGVGFIHSHYFA